MCRLIVKRALGLGALALVLSAVASAQVGQVEGTVKIKGADGKLTPVAGATVDMYRTDIKGQYLDLKTDKSGHFVRLGIPLTGVFVFVASGPGMQPTWITGVRVAQSPDVPIVASPGDGSKLSQDQLNALIAGKSPGGAPAGGSAPAAAPGGDKAKDAKKKEEEAARLKESKDLQDTFDQARTHYNSGVEFMKTANYQGAVPEFTQAAAIDPGKSKYFIELAYRSNASLAEAHYQIGVDLFNKKDREGAKPHFEAAIASITKAIAVAGTEAPGSNANLNNDIITYYNIYAKNVNLLVEHYGTANLVDDAIKSFEKAATADEKNKGKWAVMEADLYRNSGRTDDAVAAYKKILTADPNNVDALYGLGLTLIAGTEKPQIQEGANALADFVAKAPPTDKRVPIVKDALEGVKNAYKVEAEKPAKRGRKP